MKIYDCLIIGAGVVGASLARLLSFYELDVAVAERHPDVAMEATKANSAIVHGGYAESHATLKGRMCYPGRVQLIELAAELSVPYHPLPSLVVGHEENRLAMDALLENGLRNGLPDIRIIEHNELYEREPTLAEGYDLALLCEGAGTISPYELTIALADDAARNGVSYLLNTAIETIHKADDHFVLTADTGEYRAKYVVNAAGVSASFISSLLGITDYEIRPRSGEYLVLRRDSHVLPSHSIFRMPSPASKGILVTRTPDGNIMLGPDAVNIDEPDRDTHLHRLEEIWKQALLIRPDLKPQNFIRSFSGVRAASSLGDFVIRGGKVPGFVEAAGIESPGLTASPVIAGMLLDLLKEEGMETIPKTQRTPALPPIRRIKSKDEWLKQADVKAAVELDEDDPDRIVCRCEQVRLKEIREALDRPIPSTTVDGIKRRTRAGMGFCQGSFCRSRVVRVLEKESGAETSQIREAEDAVHSGISRVGRAELIKALTRINPPGSS